MPVDKHNRTLSGEELAQLREQTNLDHLVDTPEAAGLLDLRPQTLRRWSSEGSGPLQPVRIGNRLRWRVADIRRLLAGESVAA